MFGELALSERSIGVQGTLFFGQSDMIGQDVLRETKVPETLSREFRTDLANSQKVKQNVKKT